MATETRFSSTQAHKIGDEVHNVIVEIDGESHAAFVRITGIVSQQTREKPDWMSADSAGGRLYPLTETVYTAEVIRSRPSSVPAFSDALGDHFGRLASDD